MRSASGKNVDNGSWYRFDLAFIFSPVPKVSGNSGSVKVNMIHL